MERADHLPLEQARGWTQAIHVVALDFAKDKTNQVMWMLWGPMAPGMFLRHVALHLKVPFKGGALRELIVDVGVSEGVPPNDKPNQFLRDQELLAPSHITAISENSTFNCYAFGKKAFVTARFTATGGNLNQLTEGDIVIGLDIVGLP